MKVFPGPLLRRLAKDLVALCRLIDMIRLEQERQNGKAARRAKRAAAREEEPPLLDPDEEWPE